MKKTRTEVSDHAIIRYLERVHGYDIDALRANIAARVDEAACAGAVAVVIDGFRYVFQDGDRGPVLTTILTAQMATGLQYNLRKQVAK